MWRRRCQLQAWAAGRCDSVTVDFVALLMRLVYHLSRHTEKPDFSVPRTRFRNCRYVPVIMPYVEGPGEGERRLPVAGVRFSRNFLFLSPPPNMIVAITVIVLGHYLSGGGAIGGSAPCQICLWAYHLALLSTSASPSCLGSCQLRAPSQIRSYRLAHETDASFGTTWHGSLLPVPAAGFDPCRSHSLAAGKR